MKVMQTKEITKEMYEVAVFGKSVATLVPELQPYTDSIDAFFEKQIAKAEPFDLANQSTAMRELEQYVVEHFFHTNDATEDLNTLLTSIPNIKPGLFFSDETIEHILQEHPPTCLEDFLATTDHQSHFSPRAKLSFTRYTENGNWQRKYFELLQDITPDAFEYRMPECIDIEAADFSQLAQKNGHTLKPWCVSHCKETGVILFFNNHSPNSVTPYLLRLSVFLHYLFEVSTFATCLEKNSHLHIGQLTRNIIQAKEPLFPFLRDGNAHDETLYWRSTIAELDRLIPNFAEKIKPKVGIVDGALYFNDYIDTLWNLNKIENTTSHLYHYQQDTWLALLEYISDVSAVDFKKSIEESLMLDNVTFMKYVLQSKRNAVYS